MQSIESLDRVWRSKHKKYSNHLQKQPPMGTPKHHDWQVVHERLLQDATAARAALIRAQEMISN